VNGSADPGASRARELFLGAGAASRHAYTQAIADAQSAVLAHFASLERPFSGASPRALEQRFARFDPCPEEGEALDAVLRWAGEYVLADAIAVSHPLAMAHLHCAPMIPALAAEVMLSAANASMDSWDQAPAPSHLEQRVVEWLAQRFGLGEHADGVFTSGGTQSNFMGLLLARDRHCARAFGVSVQRCGLPAEAARLRVLCSSVAHFSVQQSAAILGLGHDAVVPIPVDAAQRMEVHALDATMQALRRRGLEPMAVVATAGTTDFGSIDPMDAVADVAARERAWLHVDAAYGGALVLSDRLRDRLAGIARADSVAVDFHKLFWQPISASALLVRDRASWEVLRLHADYLNPADAEAEGVLDLVTKSIQTTRRFDALKLVVSLRVLGRRRFAALVEDTVDLAQAVAQRIADDPWLVLVAPATINAVVFRCVGPGWSDDDSDRINAQVRAELLHSGHAVIGRTRVAGRTCLKLTLLNPGIGIAALERLLADVKAAAARLAA
jgi:L-2,4-diaminobutyrate decarboxylase